MKNMTALKAISLVVCLQLLSGCRFEVAKNPTSSQNGTKTGVTQPGPMHPGQSSQGQKVQGTSDSGGGNGIDNKMLESYIIDPTELSEVKDLVIPILVNTNRKEGTLTFTEADSKKSEEDAKQEAEKSTYNFFKLKTWYLAPVELKNLPKKALGIDFSESTLQQIAIQTENEIWIDANLYSKMSKEEKAKLIMHEVVMNMYLTKFYTIDEICKISERLSYDEKKDENDDACKNSENRKNLERFHKVEPPRTLNGNDYNSIREATAFLFKNQEKLNEGLWKRKMKSLNFAGLITHDNSSSGEFSYKELTFDEIKQMFEAAKVTNKLPTDCHFVEFKVNQKCELEFNFKAGSEQFIPYELELKIKDSNGNYIKSMTFAIYNNHSASKNLNKNSSLFFTSGVWNASTIGTNRNHFEIVFDDTGILELAFKSEKLIGHTEKIKEVDGKKQKCTTSKWGNYNPKTIEENTVYVNHGKPDSESITLNYKFSSGYENCVDVPNEKQSN